MAEIRPCKLCGALIEIVRSCRTGRPMALDAESSDSGRLVVSNGVAHPALLGDNGGLPRRVAHAETCTGTRVDSTTTKEAPMRASGQRPAPLVGEAHDETA